MTNLRLGNPEIASFDADAVVIGVVSTDSDVGLAPGAESVDRAFDGGLAAVLAGLGATGEAGEVTKIPTFGKLAAPVLVAVGLGASRESFDGETLRRAAGAALRVLAGSGSAAVALPATTVEEVTAVTAGALLGNYAYLNYRTGNGHKQPVAEVTVLSEGVEGADAALRRAEVLAESVTLVRDLVNTPPSDLSPEILAETAEQVGADAGLSIEVLDEKALVEGGYGGIAGVGQGSVNPPRLVRLAYDHPEASHTVAFVGKGITFDSGGLSLKPADSMDWMKSDMGGAAAVLGAMKAIAALAPKAKVVGYLAIAENMPSGTAQRPSDVINMYGGKTVEVLNTDAEGRLVMADAIVRAGEDDPDLIIDVATLTGAQLVALGTRTAGVMANDDAVRDRVVAAAGRAGEAAWPMPLPEELRKGLDSAVADIANISGERWGGMLTAGVFLKEFVPEGVRWAHLDIAGPAFHKGEPYGYTPKGGTGAAVRTLVQIVEDVAADGL
ncbi:leucyl aminopeptidase [Actinomadura sp. DC4]|uniref:leucyl aminopeptidase n=1 Tax=Actinomadura sp. DC4 TaxID=3055069 RepID=UPI0025B099AF|nr:leucyl aminopeptidase [Actinomadura sp. DC4]MDN3353251.1 leucyl aminopeptidase [Actinomadura sp. DC4]